LKPASSPLRGSGLKDTSHKQQSTAQKFHKLKRQQTTLRCLVDRFLSLSLHTRKDGTTPFRLLAVGVTAYVPATSDPASHTRIGIQRRTRTRASQPGASASLHPADSRTQCDRSKVTLSSIYSPLAHFSKMPGKEISFF